MAQAESLQYTRLPTDLTPEVVGMCNDLFDRFSDITGSPGHFFGELPGDNVEIVSLANCAALWHQLCVGEAVLNLQLSDGHRFNPPRSLGAVGRWSTLFCPISIEYPAVTPPVKELDVRLVTSRSPDAGYYELKPSGNGDAPELITHSGHRAVLLTQAGASDAQGLSGRLEQAIQGRDPDYEHAEGSYSVGVWSSRSGDGTPGSYDSSAIRTEEWRTRTEGVSVRRRRLEITASTRLRFVASWTLEPGVEDPALRVQYNAWSDLPDGISWWVPRAGFGPDDQSLVRSTGNRLLAWCAKYPPAHR